jgi:hypothetical protein
VEGQRLEPPTDPKPPAKSSVRKSIANPASSSSPQASSDPLLQNSQNPWIPAFGWLHTKTLVNTEKEKDYHSQIDLPVSAYSYARSPPQALLQNSQNPWAPDFGCLPTKTLVNTKNYVGADYPDYGSPLPVPNAWKGSQDYGIKTWPYDQYSEPGRSSTSRTYVGKGNGLETEKRRKAETNGKAEADKISFTPRHQVQLMLTGRFYVGASIDNTSPYSFFSLHEACLITPQRINPRDT